MVEPVVDTVLERVARGETTKDDADRLRAYIDRLQNQLASRDASIKRWEQWHDKVVHAVVGG